MTLSSVNTIWVLVGRCNGLLHAGGLFPVRGRLHPGEEHRQHPDEESDGLLHWHAMASGCSASALCSARDSAVVGWLDPCITRDYSHYSPAGVPLWAFAIFQTVFCATSATIVSGAMAERTKFSAYCIYSACHLSVSSIPSPATGSGAAAG